MPSLPRIYFFLGKSSSFGNSTLSSSEYTASIGTNEGFILKHSVGYLLAGSEVDVPLTYADYYYVEALLRYKHYVLKLS